MEKLGNQNVGVIQDEDKVGERRKEGFFATKLTSGRTTCNLCDFSLHAKASTYVNLHSIWVYRISVSEYTEIIIYDITPLSTNAKMPFKTYFQNLNHLHCSHEKIIIKHLLKV